ncbi:MAG: ATP-binding protein [Bacillales bacterium]|jgi:tRNA threonylcarbamoyladenosine biosynthesis protein TsaE|nr:ATP-binding protein [Bacillales bacterium]
MEKYTYLSKSSNDTTELALKIGMLLDKGSVITLEGDLGAGKTTFTKGLAKGLHIERNVNSPTFTIIKEYKGRLPLYHMDVYRVESSDEDLGFDEYFYGDGVTVVEWAHLIEEQLPENRLEIVIKNINDNERQFTFYPLGEIYIEICKEIFEC